MSKRNIDLRNNAELATVTRSTSVEDFFERGRRIAREVDSAKPILPERIISFEDPVDMLHVLTPTRITLVKAVRQQADSITNLAKRLRRGRSAVARDVKALAEYGLVDLCEVVNPGHGRHKEVRSRENGALKLEVVID